MDREIYGIYCILAFLMAFVLYIAYQMRHHSKHIAQCHRIHFMNEDETKTFLANDTDHYFADMSDFDWMARGVQGPELYMKRIQNNVRAFTPDQKWRLCQSCQEADAFFIRTNTFGFEKTVANIPWKFALVEGHAYEEGLPHTREDIIFLSTNVLVLDANALIKTLIHEKVHIYQRAHPEDMKRLLYRMGFTPIERRQNIRGIRANPDVNAFVYKDKNGTVYLACYKSSSPQSIRDVRHEDQDPRLEHPYEQMAYDIADAWETKSI